MEGGVSHRVFLSGTHWLASTLGSCLCMKLSASTELGTIFLLQPQHLLRVAVGCSLCDTRIFMSSPTDLVSLYIWPKSAQTFSPYKGKVKGRMFLEHLLPHLCTGKARDAHFELLPHDKAQLMSPWDYASQKSLKKLPYWSDLFHLL